MGLVNLIRGFFRLGPVVLGLLAAAVLGAGIYLQIGQNTREVQKAQALLNGPPAPVDVAAFSREAHMTELREAVLIAQPVIDHAAHLTLEGRAGEDHAFMMPLTGAAEGNPAAILGVAIYAGDGFTFDDLTPELILGDMTKVGPVGPVVPYNGRIGGYGKWDDLVEEAFASQGLALPENPVVIWPYLEGREAEMAPRGADETTVFGLFSKVAGVIALLALGKLALHGTPNKTIEGEGADMMPDVSDVSPVPATPQAIAPAAAFVAEAEAEQMPPRRRGIGLRKALTVLVGLAFAVLLVAVVYDMVSSAMPAQTTTLPSPEERAAAQLVQAIVPEAAPDRHWTEIDITPAIEWVTAKALLAVGGDRAAQLLLGSIVGGLLLALFMLKFYFKLRRAFTPKVSPRIDSMGL